MTKRRDELAVTPLTAALTSAMRELASDRRHVHAEIWARWRDIVGPEVYRRSFPISLRGKVLTIGVSSSPWLQEMSFLKTSLVDRLAEEIGAGVVAEVKLVLDPGVGSDGGAPVPADPDAVPRPPATADIGPELLAETARLPDRDLRAAVERAIAAGLRKRPR
jgi:hypothetical protein